MAQLRTASRQTPLTPRRWTRPEYDHLVALGMFDGEPLELLGGQLVVAEPQHAYHASAVTRLDYALRALLPGGWIVRLQAPLALDAESEPEPDLVVVSGAPDAYDEGHPARVVLAVEVADASLAFDREHKAGLYARAGIADYWIVNLVERQLEVHRAPGPEPLARFGWRYRSVTALEPPARVAPLAFPAAHVAVADLLPRRSS